MCHPRVGFRWRTKEKEEKKDAARHNTSRLCIIFGFDSGPPYIVPSVEKHMRVGMKWGGWSPERIASTLTGTKNRQIGKQQIGNKQQLKSALSFYETMQEKHITLQG